MLAPLGALLLATTLLVLVPPSAPAGADYDNPAAQGPLHPMTFPVIGRVSYTDTFLAPRAGHLHQGQDLLGKKMQPLVAAVDGTVTQLTIPQAAYGYALVITGDDGWSYSYLHVNNDTPGTDDGMAPLEDVYAPGIALGQRVNAGQLVAYLGDSGNAETGSPHLHFELHDPTGAAVNGYASLKAAERVTSPAAAPPPSAATPAVRRLAGQDRVDTAVLAARAGWPAGAARVVIAAADQYAEALPASVLAGKLDAPLLLTGASGLTDPVVVELDRLRATAATVVGSVPASVDRDLQAHGLAVTRVAGTDAVTTAARLAWVVGAADKTAVLVNKDRFPDGVSAAGLAAGRDWPVLLSGDRVIPQATVDELRLLGVRRVYLVGGNSVLGDKIAAFVPGGIRLAGADRYATAVAAVEESVRLGDRSLDATYLTTGTNYPDALTAGALSSRARGVVLMVDGSGQGADGASRTFLGRHAGDVRVAAVLGGTRAVTGSVAGAIAKLLAVGS